MKIEFEVDRIKPLIIELNEDKSSISISNYDIDDDVFDENDIELSISASGMEFNKYIKIIGFLRYIEDAYKIKIVHCDDINYKDDIIITGFICINISRLTILENVAIRMYN